MSSTNVKPRICSHCNIRQSVPYMGRCHECQRAIEAEAEERHRLERITHEEYIEKEKKDLLYRLGRVFTQEQVNLILEVIRRNQELNLTAN